MKGKYLDERSRQQIIRERREAMLRKRMRKVFRVMGLFFSNAVLLWVITSQLINPFLGMVAIAATSAWFGYKIAK